jgi:hypothetical protein
VASAGGGGVLGVTAVLQSGAVGQQRLFGGSDSCRTGLLGEGSQWRVMNLMC